MSVILTKSELLKRNISSGISRMVESYNPESNKKNSVILSGQKWEGTEAHAKVWNRIEDIKKKANSGAAYQNPSDLYDFLDLIRVDITRRAMANADYTSEIAQEVTNPNFSASVTLQEFLKYAAPFQKFEGTGDQVKILQPKTGATGSVLMYNYGIGWAGRSLNDQLYDSIFDLAKVNDAIAEGYALRRNEQTIGAICSETYDASQKEAADTTSGASVDQLYYNTLNGALNLLSGLKDPQNPDEYIDVTEATLICNPSRLRQISRVINGQLTNGATIQNVNALGEISTVIPYGAKNIYFGKETISFTGCAAGKAYLFVPQTAFYVLNKRGITVQTGAGDALSFTSEKTAWHIVQGEYTDEFFGATAGGTSGTGYVVEITLPSL